MPRSVRAALRLAAPVVVALVPVVPARAAPPSTPAPPARLEECDALVKRAPDDYPSYDCYRTLAHTRQAWDGAVARLESLLAANPRNTLARVVLARVENDRGRPRAADLFRQAADEFAAARMPVGEVFARLDLAFLLRRRGRLDEADDEVGRARSAAEASKVALLLANVRAEEAWIARQRADFGRAEALFRQAESEVFPRAPWALQASVLSGIGATLWGMGRNQEALVYYRRLAEGHRQRGDLYQEAAALYNLALVSGALAREGASSAAEHDRLLHEALDAAVRGGNRSMESAIRQAIAEDPRLDLETRLKETRRALALAEEIGESGLFSRRELARLMASEGPGHCAAAYRIADDAVERARASGDQVQVARGLIRRAQIRWMMGPRPAALAEAEAAFSAIEAIRDRQGDDLIRARVESEWAHLFYVVSGALLDAGGEKPETADLDRAIAVMERLRGRILLDALDAAQVSRSGPGFAPPRRAAPPTLEELRQALTPDEALLAFQIPDATIHPGSGQYSGGSWVVVVTREGARAHRLPPEDLLAGRVAGLLGFIGRRDGSDAAGAVRLYDDLLRPALGDLPAAVTRLIVIPDRSLFRLPFDALRPALDAPPVGARAVVSIAPSAALWLRWRRSAGSREAAVPALVFADPEVALVASASAAETASTAPAPGPAADPGAGLGPLPRARSEARAIVGSLGGGSRAWVGGRASEARLKGADLRRYRLLHFAAHAVIDDLQPQRSALLLSAGGAGEDGRLHIREIVGLDLRGSTVVLSACRSSAGTVLRGEGAMSLARGFLQAGADGVIGSLWPLRDDDAAALVPAFYDELARGAALGEALQRARMRLRRAGAPTAAWAAWILIGDAGAVPFPGGRPAPALPPWLLPALALLVLGGAPVVVLLVVRRRRQPA